MRAHSRLLRTAAVAKLMHQSGTFAMGTSTSLGARAPSATDGGGGGARIRILCLHGKGGNGDYFMNNSLLPLRSLVEKRASMTDDQECADGVEDKPKDFSFEWEHLTAPYEIDGTRGYSWWTMPPGVRSYNALEVSSGVH